MLGTGDLLPLYRAVCTKLRFPVSLDASPDELGPVGRAFLSGLPESSDDLSEEAAAGQPHALGAWRHHVRSALFLPIFGARGEGGARAAGAAPGAPEPRAAEAVESEDAAAKEASDRVASRRDGGSTAEANGEAAPETATTSGGAAAEPRAEGEAAAEPRAKGEAPAAAAEPSEDADAAAKGGDRGVPPAAAMVDDASAPASRPTDGASAPPAAAEKSLGVSDAAATAEGPESSSLAAPVSTPTAGQNGTKRGVSPSADASTGAAAQAPSAPHPLPTPAPGATRPSQGSGAGEGPRVAESRQDARGGRASAAAAASALPAALPLPRVLGVLEIAQRSPAVPHAIVASAARVCCVRHDLRCPDAATLLSVGATDWSSVPAAAAADTSSQADAQARILPGLWALGTPPPGCALPPRPLLDADADGRGRAGPDADARGGLAAPFGPESAPPSARAAAPPQHLGRAPGAPSPYDADRVPYGAPSAHPGALPSPAPGHGDGGAFDPRFAAPGAFFDRDGYYAAPDHGRATYGSAGPQADQAFAPPYGPSGAAPPQQPYPFDAPPPCDGRAPAFGARPASADAPEPSAAQLGLLPPPSLPSGAFDADWPDGIALPSSVEGSQHGSRDATAAGVAARGNDPAAQAGPQDGYDLTAQAGPQDGYGVPGPAPDPSRPGPAPGRALEAWAGPQGGAAPSAPTPPPYAAPPHPSAPSPPPFHAQQQLPPHAFPGAASGPPPPAYGHAPALAGDGSAPKPGVEAGLPPPAPPFPGPDFSVLPPAGAYAHGTLSSPPLHFAAYAPAGGTAAGQRELARAERRRPDGAGRGGPGDDATRRSSAREASELFVDALQEPQEDGEGRVPSASAAGGRVAGAGRRRRPGRPGADADDEGGGGGGASDGGEGDFDDASGRRSGFGPPAAGSAELWRGGEVPFPGSPVGPWRASDAAAARASESRGDGDPDDSSVLIGAASRSNATEPLVYGLPGRGLTIEDLQQNFGYGLKTAAMRLGVCATTLKRACRRFGIRRWPHRSIKKAIRAEVARRGKGSSSRDPEADERSTYSAPGARAPGVGPPPLPPHPHRADSGASGAPPMAAYRADSVATAPPALQPPSGLLSPPHPAPSVAVSSHSGMLSGGPGSGPVGHAVTSRHPYPHHQQPHQPPHQPHPAYPQPPHHQQQQQQQRGQGYVPPPPHFAAASRGGAFGAHPTPGNASKPAAGGAAHGAVASVGAGAPGQPGTSPLASPRGDGSTHLSSLPSGRSSGGIRIVYPSGRRGGGGSAPGSSHGANGSAPASAPGSTHGPPQGPSPPAPYGSAPAQQLAPPPAPGAAWAAQRGATYADDRAQPSPPGSGVGPATPGQAPYAYVPPHPGQYRSPASAYSPASGAYASPESAGAYASPGPSPPPFQPQGYGAPSPYGTPTGPPPGGAPPPEAAWTAPPPGEAQGWSAR